MVKRHQLKDAVNVFSGLLLEALEMQLQKKLPKKIPQGPAIRQNLREYSQIGHRCFERRASRWNLGSRLPKVSLPLQTAARLPVARQSRTWQHTLTAGRRCPFSDKKTNERVDKPTGRRKGKNNCLNNSHTYINTSTPCRGYRPWIRFVSTYCSNTTTK